MKTAKGVLTNAESTATSRAEIVDELSKWTVGGGLIVLVLFPLAVPILVLTAVALVPLLAPILALGLLVGVVALPVLLARKDVETGVPGAASGHRRSPPFARAIGASLTNRRIDLTEGHRFESCRARSRSPRKPCRSWATPVGCFSARPSPALRGRPPDGR